MKLAEKIVYIGVSIAFAFGCYTKIWESIQPKEEIKNAIVREIKPYHYNSELSWSPVGNLVYIEGEKTPIRFKANRWDRTVKVGSSVDLIIRKTFPLFGDRLEGMSIDDYQ